MSNTIFDAKRLGSSLEVLKLVEEYLRENPGMRLNQALINLNVVKDEADDFYTEPWITLDRVRAQLTILKG
jgi:hypothetical protein